MKKYLSVSLVIILLLSGLFVFTGCGKEENEQTTKKQDLSAVAGIYTGEYTKLVGDETKNEDEEFSLELKADGTGVHNRNEASYNVSWSLDGDNFKMTEKFLGMTIDYTGTLKDGKLDIYNGDPTNIWTYEYVYAK